MPELPATRDDWRALRDRPFASNAAAAVVAAVAFAALFARAAQMLIERAAGELIGPDVAVDRFVADAEQAKPSQPARHLVGTPIFAQQFLDLGPVGRRELPIAPRVGPSTARIPVGELRPVAAVAGRLIAPHFPSDRAAVTPEHPGD